MIYNSLDELLHASQSLSNQHLPILGMLMGMAAMANNLALL
jgi:hypothetical protein